MAKVVIFLYTCKKMLKICLKASLFSDFLMISIFFHSMSGTPKTEMSGASFCGVGMGTRDATARVRMDIFTWDARANSCAHDMSVAPVVVTSSTSKICLFAMRWGWTNRKIPSTFSFRS